MGTMEGLPREGGVALLDDPLVNKGTAFSTTERVELRLDGLLPPVVETLEQRAVRACETFSRYGDDLAGHDYLRSSQDTNEVLFYKPAGDQGAGGLDIPIRKLSLDTATGGSVVVVVPHRWTRLSRRMSVRCWSEPSEERR